MAGVAHLVRAPGCGSGGSGFETRRLPHLYLGSYTKSHLYITDISKVFLRKNCDKEYKLYQVIQRYSSSKFLPKRRSFISHVKMRLGII
jgi:hypothetical protein